jgi:hypothetical protein
VPKAPIFRGTDAVTLFVSVPLLALSFLLYRRGSLRGALLLVGVLGFFLYYSASLAFSDLRLSLYTMPLSCM